MPQRSNIQFEEFEEASILKKEANEDQGCQNLKYNVGKVTTRMGNEVTEQKVSSRARRARKVQKG